MGDFISLLISPGTGPLSDLRYRQVRLAGCPAVREKSGKFQTWQKSGKSQGILLKVREKNEYWEKSGKSQGMCI